MKKWIMALAASGAVLAFAYTPPKNTNTVTRAGVTYAQRGGLGSADYVVTNFDGLAMLADESIAAGAWNAVSNRTHDLIQTEIAEKRDLSDRDFVYNIEESYYTVVTNISNVRITTRDAEIASIGTVPPDRDTDSFPYLNYDPDNCVFVDESETEVWGGQSSAYFKGNGYIKTEYSLFRFGIYGDTTDILYADGVVYINWWNLPASGWDIGITADYNITTNWHTRVVGVETNQFALISEVTNSIVTKSFIERLGIECGVLPSEVTNIAQSVANTAVGTIANTIPNNITRNNHTATFVNCPDGTCTNSLFTLGQANHSLAGLMTAEDKIALDDMSSLPTEVGTLSGRVDNLGDIVTTWEGFLDGSNVVFNVTNYLSGTYSLDHPKLKIQELRSGGYTDVYDSRSEIVLHITNFETNKLAAITNALITSVNEAVGGKADKAWGKYTSAGGEAPSNTVYMTHPNTVFAGGLEYERVAVGEGAICVLTTKGAPVWTQGDEGTFKFQDDGGTNYFGFAKTDSYTIGAKTDGISVSGGLVSLTYDITMSGRPCVWYKPTVAGSAAWEQLNLPDGSAVAGASHAVTWDENPPAGQQICYINCENEPAGFFKASVEVAGEAKFMTNMPADLSGGIICTNTATGVNGVIKPSFNGSTVNWTWSAR